MTFPALVIAVSSLVYNPAKSNVDIRVSGAIRQHDATTLAGIVGQVLNRLPSAMVAKMVNDEQPVLRIHVQLLNRALGAEDVCGPSDKTLGYFDRRDERVVLSLALVDRALYHGTDAGQPGCGPASWSGFLKATVVHELGHFLDHRIHSSPSRQFEALLGGEAGHRLVASRNRIRNFNAAASPDPYEFRNRREAFAVNFEHYILDPTFRCARPAMTAWFDQIAEVKPNDSCSDHSYVLLNSSSATDNLTRLALLDRSRVYQIQYLHASDGEGFASRWGHSMFRIVMCAPSRPETDALCLADTEEDLVLSYRANVADLTLNYLKGLTGDYPSQLFVFDLPEIITEYTRLEFRDLVGVPLELTPDEVDLFIDVALERYWNYQGKYYFVTNNCGTETLRHLRAALAEEPHLKSRTPRKLFRTLMKTDLVAEAFLDEFGAGMDPGPNFFPSKRPLYESAFDSIQSLGGFPELTMEAYLDRTTAAQRMTGYKSFLAKLNADSSAASGREALLSKLLLLERLARSREEERTSEQILKRLQSANRETLDAIRRQVLEFYKEPWDLVDADSYGVPPLWALESYLSRSEERLDRLQALDRIIRDDVGFADLRAQIDAIRSVQAFLSQRLALEFVDGSVDGG